MLEPEDSLAGLKRMIEKERKAASRGNPEAEAKAWLQELAMIEVERKGWLRHAARGKMSDAELDEELAPPWRRCAARRRPSCARSRPAWRPWRS
jgi:hypothetical protein